MKIVSLIKRKDFVNIAENGKKAVTKGLVLQALQHNRIQDNSIHLGYTATKKLGNAVTRNRIKRKLRAVVANVMKDRATPSHDYVIIGRHSAFERHINDLAKDLKFALHSTDTYKTNN
ncbi:MAG: rnpA [Rickettsiaceae bacterium]|jgi:ribonuclease P protein component|nr:rnpA [Rickettsiaceae bacterium]